MEVSAIIMVVVSSFVWFVDWTDCFILKGGITIFDIFSRSVFLPKNFGAVRIACSLWLTDFLFFGIWFSVFVKNTYLIGFGFDLWCGFRIFLLAFRFLFDPSGHYAPPLISNSRETSVCSTCQHCIGSIKVSRTGMWTFICFDGFACGFRFLTQFCFYCCCFVCFFVFFCGFAVVDDFFLRFLIDPLTDSCFANWKSLFLKLQIFLFVLFRVLNKSRPCLVISSEIVRGILLIFNFFYFLEIKCSCLFHFTLEFMTESEGNVGWKLGCLCQTACSCLCLHYHISTF